MGYGKGCLGLPTEKSQLPPQKTFDFLCNDVLVHFGTILSN